jgi:hypothetical protein
MKTNIFPFLVKEVKILQKGQVLFTHSTTPELKSVICLETTILNGTENFRCIPYAASPLKETTQEVSLPQSLIKTRFMGAGIMESPEDQKVLSIISERKLCLSGQTIR